MPTYTRCARCGWNNPKSHQSCFSCHSPLSAPTAPSPAVADDPDDVSIIVRLIASTIDLALMLAGALALLLLWWMYRDTPWADSLFLPMLAGALAMLLLPGLTDPYGGSPGRRLMGIELRRPDGRPPGLLASVVRHVLKYGLVVFHFLGSHLIARLVFKRDFLHEVASSARIVRRPGETS